MNLRIYCRYLFRSLFRWLVFVSSALYFLYCTQLLLVYTQQRQQLFMTSSLNNNVKIDRSRCCVRPSPMVSIKDVCGRVNCTEDCPDPVRLPIDTGRENAFFLETSGSGTLTIRQACSVESLAYHNPNLNVNVLFMMEHDEQIEKINNRSKGIETIEKLHEKYKNIQMMLVSLDEFIAGTALEKWYHCTDWRKGPYHVSHLSDGLRFLTLKKFGGYYFDLDVLIVKSVMMYRNFIARESNYNLASNSIHADLGNPVIEMAVKNFVSNYRSDIWAHNGPALLLRVLKKRCNTTMSIVDVGSLNSGRCQEFNVLHKSSFNPVHFADWRKLFVKRPSSETGTPKWLTEEVFGVHTWNKLSFKELVYKNSTQEYARLARDNCPNMFSLAPYTF